MIVTLEGKLHLINASRFYSNDSYSRYRYQLNSSLSFQPSNSSSTSSIFSNLQLPLSFAPSLTTPSASGSESTCFDSNGLDSTLQPLPFSPSRFHSSSDVFLSSASQFGPIGTRPPSAKSSASTDEGIHMGSGDGNTTIENGSELLFTKIVDDKDQIAIFSILY